MSDLSADDREALRRVFCESVTCVHVGDMWTCQKWAEAYEPVVAAIVRRTKAEAWDEGVRRCDLAWHDGESISVFDRNPYRPCDCNNVGWPKHLRGQHVESGPHPAEGASAAADGAGGAEVGAE